MTSRQQRAESGEPRAESEELRVRLCPLLFGLCPLLFALCSPLLAQETAFIGQRLDELARRLDAQAKLVEPPAGITRLPLGTTDFQQLVVPRYANGHTHPAGQVIGNGPGSVARGTRYDSTNPQPIIVTEDFDQDIKQWSSGKDTQDGTTFKPAVLMPVFRDFTLVGADPKNNAWAAGSAVNGRVGEWSPATTHPDLEHGLYAKGSAAQIENVNFFHIAGTACTVSRGWGLNWGNTTPFDRSKFLIHNCRAARAYRGFHLAVVDGVVGDLSGMSLRDYGLKVTGGALQFQGAIHFWGISAAGKSATPSPAVWFTSSAGACWGGPWYPENSEIGMLIESSRNSFHDVYSHACWYGNLRIHGHNNTLVNLDIQVSPGVTTLQGREGILVGGKKTKLSGRVYVPDGEIGVRITQPEHQTLDLDILGASEKGTGTGISVDTQINRSRLDIDAQWLAGGVGLDLMGPEGQDRIGAGNRIWVTSTQAKPIELAPVWTTTPDDSETNEVYVNGVRYYRKEN